MIMIYAYIIQNYGTIDVGNEFVAGTMLGNFRAFAGLCAGAFTAYLNSSYMKLRDRRGGRTFLQIMDVFSWVMAVLLFVFPKDVIPDADMLFWMIPFSAILLNGINDLGPVSHWLNSHFCTLWARLGRMGMYIFLLHIQIVLLCRHVAVKDNSIAGSILILAAVLAFAAMVMTIREKIWPGID